jgi:hypothetical protein
MNWRRPGGLLFGALKWKIDEVGQSSSIAPMISSSTQLRAAFLNTLLGLLKNKHW